MKRRGSTDPDAFCLIAAVENRLPPATLVQIPFHGLLDPGLEGLGGPPAELGLDLGGVDRVAAVVAGPVGDERDQTLARRQIGGVMLIQEAADRFHHVQVGALVAAADVVGLADATAFQHQRERPRVVLHIEPIADVLAVAIDRQVPAPPVP